MIRPSGPRAEHLPEGTRHRSPTRRRCVTPSIELSATQPRGSTTARRGRSGTGGTWEMSSPTWYGACLHPIRLHPGMTAVPDLQVEAAHYAFTAYMPKRRWASVWHQMTEVERFEPRSVFELGPGPGLLQRLISSPERTVVTADIDPSLRSEEHTSELQSLMRSSYAVFCLQ